MTYYVGDTIEIAAGANDFDGNPVSSSTATARLSIHEIGGEGEPVADAEMDFTGAGFTYIWNTLGVAAGGYRAQVTLDVQGRKSVEVRPVVLADPDPD
jgi:hypothetical protein